MRVSLVRHIHTDVLIVMFTPPVLAHPGTGIVIDDKGQDAARLKSGQYARYMLVIHTGEMFLYREVVREYLSDASFRAMHITDAFLKPPL